MRRTQRSLFALLVLSLGLVACGERFTAPAVSADVLRTRVRVVKAKREDISVARTLIGTLRPWRQAVIAARASGDVLSLSVERGDRVKRGQLIGTLRVPGLSEEVAATVANTEVAEASLGERSEVAERMKRVAAANAAALSSEEVTLAEKKAAAASAKLRASHAGAARVKALLRDAALVAPFDGIVLMRYVDAGATVAPGARLVEVAELDTMRLIVDVPEREGALVHGDAPVVVTIPSLSNEQIDAKVSRFAPAVDTRTRMLRVEVDIKNDGAISTGAEARVRFVDAGAKGVLTIPADALVAQADGAFVFVVKDGKAARIAIQIGFDDGAKVEVRRGLTGQEDIIVNPGGLLEDGAPVEVAR